LGTELADHARYKGVVQGILHTDELPKYKIKKRELELLRTTLNAKPEDAIVLVAGEEEACYKALKAVIERTKQALGPIPEETRSANPDGTSRFTRPRPGAARMYPETDVKMIKVSQERLEIVRKNLPEKPEKKIERYQKEYKLNKKLAKQILDSEYKNLFEELAIDLKGQTTLIAVTLTEDLTKIRRDGVPVEELTGKHIKNTFKLIEEGKTVKESIPELLTYLAYNPEKMTSESLEALGLELLNEEELENFIKSKIEENNSIIKKMGNKAFGPIMGIVMSEIRGKAKAQDVQKLIQKHLLKKIEIQKP
jgi:glutamyl-tRNA(Gln) amidotransferase subunit E